MRIRWRGLELPSQVIQDEQASTDKYGRFIIEPFERGFGTTIGNSLRRILLSSLEGAAVTRVKIAGVGHEFTSLDGVLEDVTNIILNVKGLILRLNADGPKTMTVSRETRGEVRAGDIEADPAIDIINRDHVLATLTDDVSFSMEMTVETGRGYRPAEETAEAEGEQEIGVIPVDAIFSPVSRVRYRTEETRVGQRVNYDRLIMEIWTKGVIGPQDALVEAAKILRKHLNPFVQSAEPGEAVVSEASAAATEPTDVDEELQRKLAQPISALDLSVRASNCLESARIATVGELVQMGEADLLQVRSFGRTSLREVKRKLQDLGLSLGMNASGGTSPRSGCCQRTRASSPTMAPLTRSTWGW